MIIPRNFNEVIESKYIAAAQAVLSSKGIDGSVDIRKCVSMYKPMDDNIVVYAMGISPKSEKDKFLIQLYSESKLVTEANIAIENVILKCATRSLL